MTKLEAFMQEKAPTIKEFWFDVDGVMTPQGAITIYDVRDGGALIGFERKDGITSTRLVPCDEHGTPRANIVECIAGYGDEPIMEGYRFDPRDGKVVEYLVENGFPVYFISGRDSACVRKRALALGATPLLGVKDKLALIREKANSALGEIMFIGDGIQDVETLRAVGFSVAPKDASPEALFAAHVCTDARGGEGVLSEVITLFLKTRGLWPA